MEEAWELFRRGQRDEELYRKLVSDAIRRRLPDLVTSGEITAGGKVRIPIYDIPQWRFEFDPEQHEHTNANPQDGQGQGRPQKGDVIGRRPQQGQGPQPGEGGDGEGDGGYLEAEIGVEQVAAEVFAGLELPRIQRKAPSDAYTESYKHEDIRKKGPMSNLDKRLTVLNNVRRNAAAGDPGFHDLADDDLRFRTTDIRRNPHDKVAVVLIRDRSGSMGEEEKRLTRILAFWITRFLQHKYGKVAEVAFVLHDTKAEEVNEEEFFHKSEGGGTEVSSGFRLAQEIIRDRFPPDQYNLYIFAFSDGDNGQSDNYKVAELVRELLTDVNLIGYADITPEDRYRTASGLRQTLTAIEHPHVVVAEVKSGEDIPIAMKSFFGKRGGPV